MRSVNCAHRQIKRNVGHAAGVPLRRRGGGTFFRADDPFAVAYTFFRADAVFRALLMRLVMPFMPGSLSFFYMPTFRRLFHAAAVRKRRPGAHLVSFFPALFGTQKQCVFLQGIFLPPQHVASFSMRMSGFLRKKR